MSQRKAIKLSLDIGMFVLMLFLLSYPLTRGLLRHGLLGMTFLGTVLLHQCLNLAWYRSLGHGVWKRERIVLVLVDSLLILSFLVLSVSGIVMAGEIFAFMPFAMPYWARSLHAASFAWCFVFVACHLGLHGHKIWQFCEQRLGRVWLCCAFLAVSLGAYCFWQSYLWSDMVFLGEVKPKPTSLGYFLFLYIGTALFFSLLTRFVARFSVKEMKLCQTNAVRLT